MTSSGERVPRSDELSNASTGAEGTMAQVHCSFPPLLTRHCLHKGEHLHRVGDRLSALYRVRAGILKCYRVTEEGEELVLGFYMADDICGFDALAERCATSNVAALDSTNLEVLPIKVLFAADGNSDLQRQVMHDMSRELQRFSRMLQMERCSAEQRLASFLLEHSAYEQRRGCLANDFVLPMPRRDLARYLHLATETVSRVFSRLQRAGFLAIDRNHVVIDDFAGLGAAAESLSYGSPDVSGHHNGMNYDVLARPGV